MKHVLPIAVLAVAAAASVDITFCEGSGYVIWSTELGATYVAEIGSVLDPHYLGSYGNVTLSAVESGGQPYLAAGCTNEEPCADPSFLLLLDPSTLELVSSREFWVEDFGYQIYVEAFDHISLEKHTEGSDTALVVCSVRCCVADGRQYYPTYLASAMVDYGDTAELPLLDTLQVEVSPYAYIHDYRGPVSTQQLNHLSTTGYTAAGTGLFIACADSYLHQPAPDSRGEMWQHTFYSIWCVPNPLQTHMMALGSCSDEAVALWEDTSGTINYTVFSDSIAPDDTWELPFPEPGPDRPAAMSCHPEQQGLLMGWFCDGQVRVRHYRGEWNAYDHVVGEDVSWVEEGNIAIHGVPGGFWVAWLESGEDAPELVFVDSASVSGIEDLAERSIPRPRVFPNPFTACLTVDLGGDSDGEVRVYDLSGRMVARLVPDDGGVCTWNGRDESGRAVPAGAYILRAVTGGGEAVSRVVRL